MHPPKLDGLSGLPVLKRLMRERSLLPALEAMQAELGDVFQITLPGFSPVVVVGPEATRQALVTDRHHFIWRNERDPVTRLLRHGLLVEDGERHHCLRQMMEPVLQRRQVAAHVEAMWLHTNSVTAAWQDGRQYDMLDEMRRLALLILMGTLFGVDFSADMARLWPSILRILTFISPGLWIIWPEMPRPGYGRARRELDDYLHRIIRQRREQLRDNTGGAAAGDLLSQLVCSLEDDELIRDQLLTMLIAGHDTSTALPAWALYLLGRYPEVLALAQVEVDAAMGQQAPSMETLNRLRYLDWVIKEALRLYPPIHAGNRMATAGVPVQGYQIEAGTRLMVSIYLTHRHPDYWQQPACFIPERFDPQQRDQPPFTYLPFGAGPRNCIGAAFAQIEAKVVLARILQLFALQLVTKDVRPHMGATLEPRPGVVMRVQRRRKS